MHNQTHAHQNRYLKFRVGRYYYHRRVPVDVSQLDARSPTIRFSLKTRILAEAHAKRDLLEEADNTFWASLLLGDSAEKAKHRYNAAVNRAKALGFGYRTVMELAAAPLPEIAERMEIAGLHSRSDMPAVVSVLGGAEKPAVFTSEAKDIYFKEIAPAQTINKSADQKRRWSVKKNTSIQSFIDICGDKDISSISKEDANLFYRHWMEKIAPADTIATHTASSGNRALGDLRTFYTAYMQYKGELDFRNPFDGLRFKETKLRTRPPFPTEWIMQKILKPDALQNLNTEARHIVFALIETGARLSEIANQTEDCICLTGTPHIKIQPSLDPENRREIKTQSSIRSIPLVGLALDVMRRHPQGFPKYRDRSNQLSATLNKFFNEHGLFPTVKHTIYSFRHSFEDRMKEAGLDDELRRILMGHAIDRPKYGSGGAMKWRAEQLEKVKLPFDTAII